MAKYGTLTLSGAPFQGTWTRDDAATLPFRLQFETCGAHVQIRA